MLKSIKLPRYHDEPMWYNWLWEGFRKFGCNRAEHTVTDYSSNRIGFQCPMIMEINNKKIAYDFADFTKLYPHDVDLTFKIQLTKEIPGYLPIFQVVGHTAFDEERKHIKNRPFKYDVVGLFRSTNYDLRLRWLETIYKMNLRSVLALQNCKERPPTPAHIGQRKVGYHDHLKLLKSSKICLAIPGIGVKDGSCWSFRHSEILGLGRFMICPKRTCMAPGNPKGCWVECDSDELEDVVRYYLKNENEREEIAKRGKQYYERYISQKAMVLYMLENI